MVPNRLSFASTRKISSNYQHDVDPPKKMIGFDGVTVHSFHASFKAWFRLKRWEWALSEQVISHAVGSKSALASDPNKILKLRREMMDAWADFCTSRGRSWPPTLRAVHEQPAAHACDGRQEEPQRSVGLPKKFSPESPEKG